ncbi:TnpV protein [Arthrobacter sunyaminii]|uniref:TnpV protein n=1 Tax=Arthrobacter sunyaminii TaxID=2816859 RepID=UPI001F41ACF3|nr:TnpV protein [Arthrobacter sunyaminii]
MNKYGKFAQETWQTTAPKQYALIPDPEEWFRSLGEEAMRQVGELQYEIAGPDPKNETYLEKVGRLNASRMQAEEIVRAEMLTPNVMEDNEENEGMDQSTVLMHEIIQSFNHGYQQDLENLRAEETDRDNQRP